MYLPLAAAYGNLDALLIAGPAFLSALIVGIPSWMHRVRVLAVSSGVVCLGSAYWMLASLSKAAPDDYPVTIGLASIAVLVGMGLIFIKR
jgi:hypothetical protein